MNLMSKKFSGALLITVALILGNVACAAPVVIFKADDLTNPSDGAWQIFFNLIQAQDIKASVGIIAKDFVKNDQNINTVRGLHNSGRIEFWNHGYDHSSHRSPTIAPPDVWVDYDGDGITDHATKTNDGRWLIDYAANGFGAWDAVYHGYGDSSAHAAPADYDGDGKADLRQG